MSIAPGRMTVLIVGNYGPSMASARTLARAGHRVLVGDDGDFLPVAKSRSCHGIWRHPPIDDPDAFFESLAALARSASVDVVLPLRSSFVELLAKHRDRLPDGVALAAPSGEICATAVDKERMYALVAELDVPHRPTGVAHDLAGLATLVVEIGCPCVIRPSVETVARLPSRRKAIILSTADDLERQLPAWPPGHERLLVQGFAGGRRRNIHFAARAGRILARVQTEALRTDRTDGTGLGVEGHSVAPDERLDAYCESITRRLDYTGVGLYQFLVPPDSEPSFLELNPRIGTALAFVQSCGLDLALAACSLASGRGGWEPPVDTSYPVGRRYAWTSKDIFGLRVARAAGDISARESARWIGRAARAAVTADTHLTWSLRDPMPTIAIVRELIRAPRSIEPPDTLATLRSASDGLEAGQPEAVIAAIESLPDAAGPVGQALLLVAQGLRAEAAGRTDEAGRLMEEAFGSSPAHLPAVLRVLIGAFGRSGRAQLAHHAFLMLQASDPDTPEKVLRRLTRSEWADYAPWAMRVALQQGRYLTSSLAPYKRTLRDRLGAEAAALQLAAVPGRQGPRVVVRRQLVPLIEHAREKGLDYEELIPAGPARATPVRILGAAAEPESRRTRALFGCVLEDVVVTGRSGILLSGDRALMDVQEDELTSTPHDLVDDPIVAADQGNEVLLLEPSDRDALRRVPEAVWMTGVNSFAFGHWIIEYLPKVWALMEREGFGTVPILVDARLPAQHLESMRLFAGGSNPLIVLEGAEAVLVDRLWVASAAGYIAAGPEHTRLGMDDEGFPRLMDRIRPTLQAIDTSGAPAHLYLGRKPSQHRRLVNADEVQARLVEAGFVAHDFGNLPFVEQIRLVRGASWIIAPSGSAFLMAVFGRPGLRIGSWPRWGSSMPPGSARRPVTWASSSRRSSATSSDLTASLGCPTTGSTRASLSCTLSRPVWTDPSHRQRPHRTATALRSRSPGLLDQSSRRTDVGGDPCRVDLQQRRQQHPIGALIRSEEAQVDATLTERGSLV